MKALITALTVLLVASIYILMFQEAQAQSVQIYSITCEDSLGIKFKVYALQQVQIFPK
jgi:hypothetical protein